MSLKKRRQLFLSLPLEISFRPMYGSYRLDTYRSHGSTGQPLFKSGVTQRDKIATQRLNDFLGEWITKAEKEKDPWNARKEFFDSSWGDDGPSFESFTYFFGRFGLGQADLQFAQPDSAAKLLLDFRLQNDFEEWRELLRTAMNTPMETWPLLFNKFPARKVSIVQKPLPVKLQWRDGKPVGVVNLRTAVEAIIASIQIDKLNGAEFGTCARPDCREPYQIKNRHNRIYCSADCAHYMAVKNSRERAARKIKPRG